MDTSIKRTTKLVERLEKTLRHADELSVQSGYFKEQGIHSPSGMSYAALMNLHEYGGVGSIADIPERPVRFYTMIQLRENKSLWTFNVSKMLQGKQTPKQALGDIGELIEGIAKSIFGGSPLVPNSNVTIQLKGRDEPLVESGDLFEAWTWKLSTR